MSTNPSGFITVPKGLAKVVVADTELGDVRGVEGFYHYRQYSAVELAEQRRLEDVWHLLFEGDAARRRRARGVRRRGRRAARRLPARSRGPAARPSPRDGGRPARRRCAPRCRCAAARRAAGRSTTSTPTTQRADAMASCRGHADAPRRAAPAAARASSRIEPRDRPRSRGELPLHDHGRGARPREHARAVEQYLISTIDHGFNASTFTARVIASTGADLAACLVGAIGALSGPLHGGAPSRALDMLDEIGTPDRTDALGPRARRRGRADHGLRPRRLPDRRPALGMLREIARELGGDPLSTSRSAGRGRRRDGPRRAQARPRAAHERRVLRRRRDGAVRPRRASCSRRPSRRAGWSAGARTSSSRRRDRKIIRPPRATSARRRPSPCPRVRARPFGRAAASRAPHLRGHRPGPDASVRRGLVGATGEHPVARRRPEPSGTPRSP